MNKQLAQVLMKLRDTGSVAISELSAVNRKCLRPLFETEVLREERRGRGCVVVVENHKPLLAFIERHFPQGPQIISAETISRSQAVSQLRNSKHGTLNSEPVFIIAKPQQFLSRRSQSLPIGELTATAGVATFLLGEDHESYWQFNGKVALIENYEVFINWQRTSIAADMALWTAGRISLRMINWLKSPVMQDCEYFHCGDYDPVGLDEFLRLHQQIGSRVQFHTPINIDFLFNKYANSALLQNKSSSIILQRLRSQCHPSVARIVKLIDYHNAALEQEILLFDQGTTAIQEAR